MRELENWESDKSTADASCWVDATEIAENSVWATSEKCRLRTLSLYVIRSIVERHGGTIDIDLATDTINIDVPVKEQSACAVEIEEQVGSICW